jgi:26S proteasome regulatory subunit T3
MADVAVESPANVLPPHKKSLPSSIPNLDAIEGFPSDATDYYTQYKNLQAQLEYVDAGPTNVARSS